jgi:hypothetical protein
MHEGGCGDHKQVIMMDSGIITTELLLTERTNDDRQRGSLEHRRLLTCAEDGLGISMAA